MSFITPTRVVPFISAWTRGEVIAVSSAARISRRFMFASRAGPIGLDCCQYKYWPGRQYKYLAGQAKGRVCPATDMNDRDGGPSSRSLGPQAERGRATRRLPLCSTSLERTTRDRH